MNRLPREDYTTSDLAVESAGVRSAPRGVSLREYEDSGFSVTAISVTDADGARAVGRPVGNYVTLALGKVWLFDEAESASASGLLAREIRRICAPVSSDGPVLVAGLGNRAYTADSLGPRVVDGLLVTRHIRLRDSELYQKLGRREISALAPGVLGQTGIETLELIRGAVERVRPSLVIVVDSLAARSVDRLATTVQLCDTGLAPGSGIGNTRDALNADTLGVPVVAVGAPTVVSSAALVRDALSLAGIDDPLPDPLVDVLENGRSFFVSLKESDVAVASLASLIASAVNDAFKTACTGVAGTRCP